LRTNLSPHVYSLNRNEGIFIRKNKFIEDDALSTACVINNHYIYIAEDGSLIGLRKGLGWGRSLLFPAVGIGQYWILWKKLGY